MKTKSTISNIPRGTVNRLDSKALATLLELVSEELNHLAAILHVYAGGLIFMK